MRRRRARRASCSRPSAPPCSRSPTRRMRPAGRSRCRWAVSCSTWSSSVTFSPRRCVPAGHTCPALHAGGTRFSWGHTANALLLPAPLPRHRCLPQPPAPRTRPPHNLAHNHLQPATSNLPSLTRPAACLLVPPSRAASSSPSRPPMACSSRASTGSRLPTSRRRRASSNSPPKTRPCTRCRPTTASSTRATSSPRSASRRTRPPGRASPPTSYSTLSSWPPPRCPARVACPALTSRTFVPSTRRCAGSSPRSARWRARATRARRCATRSSPASSRAPSGKTSSAPTFSCA